MNKAKKAGTVIVSVLLWIIILIAALYSITVLANKDGNHVASIGGFTPLVVKSDSMAPTFAKDDMIIIKKCDTKTLEEGDIITFHTVIENQLALNTHRIVKIEDYNNGYRSFVTRGDNNAVDDEHILAEGDIVGKHVLTIPKLGKLMNFLSSSAGFLIVIVIPMFIFFVYQLYHLITVVLALKKATALEAIEEEARLRKKLGTQSDEADAGVEASGNEVSTGSSSSPETESAEQTKESLEEALARALRAKEEAERALAEARAAKEEKDKQ